MSKIKPDILGGTFSKLHIVNKQSNIASIVEEMDKEENHIIKLITTSPREELLRLRHLRKKMRNITKAIAQMNNENPRKMTFPLIKKTNKSIHKIKNLLLGDINNLKTNNKDFSFNKRKLLLNKGNSKINENKNVSVKRFKNNLNSNDNRELINSPLINEQKSKRKKLLLKSQDKQVNLYKTLNDNNNLMKTINNLKYNKRNNFITQSTSKEKRENKEKFLQTINVFSEQKLFSQRKMNIKKKTLLSKTKSENQVKKIPRLRISEAHLSDIENKLNTVYETNKLDLNEHDKTIKEFKKKYQNLFETNERLYRYDLARITKEINDQLLSLKFKDFFSYLLTILKNDDKHIINSKLDIVKEKKECPPELRLKNVKNKHKKFMGKLNKQYDWGLKVNKFMDDILHNSKKKEMIVEELKNKNDLVNEIINKKYNQDDFVDKIFENNQIYQNNLNSDFQNEL